MANSVILKELIEKLGYNVYQFELAIGAGSSSISKAIARNSTIKLEVVEKIVKKFPNVNREWLISGDGDMFIDVPPVVSEIEKIRQRKVFGNNIDPEELGLVYVPIAAQAGYSRNFEDPVFVNQLDRLYIPGLPYRGDRYRYFDVEGDSMEPTLEEGMQVIGELIEQGDWIHINDYYIYVVVVVNRILIKRLFRKDDKTIVLISDNEDLYPQEPLLIENIKELWMVKRKLDWRMMPPKRFEIKI